MHLVKLSHHSADITDIFISTVTANQRPGLRPSIYVCNIFQT